MSSFDDGHTADGAAWSLTVSPLPADASHNPVTEFTAPAKAVGGMGERPIGRVFNFNIPPDIRQDDVRFGRNFTLVRRCLTNDDREPFELQPLK